MNCKYEGCEALGKTRQLCVQHYNAIRQLVKKKELTLEQVKKVFPAVRGNHLDVLSYMKSKISAVEALS